jgi:hypothetical protein
MYAAGAAHAFALGNNRFTRLTTFGRLLASIEAMKIVLTAVAIGAFLAIAAAMIAVNVVAISIW